MELFDPLEEPSLLPQNHVFMLEYLKSFLLALLKVQPLFFCVFVLVEFEVLDFQSDIPALKYRTVFPFTVANS